MQIGRPFYHLLAKPMRCTVADVSFSLSNPLLYLASLSFSLSNPLFHLASLSFSLSNPLFHLASLSFSLSNPLFHLASLSFSLYNPLFHSASTSIRGVLSKTISLFKTKPILARPLHCSASAAETLVEKSYTL
jgi:hypothetical protein